MLNIPAFPTFKAPKGKLSEYSHPDRVLIHRELELELELELLMGRLDPSKGA
jgi:hypothetical protein